MNRVKFIYNVLFIVILSIVVLGICFYNSMIFLKSYKSPDGKFELIIKRSDLDFLTSTMPGDSSSFYVEIVLKDPHGRGIGSTRNNNNCAIFKDSIEVHWDMENNEVRYGRGKTINLKTGKVSC
ncbi:hypothetical protein DS884_01065 [Tenacibaculum sp. E3R01]|nr:hypothetical protein DS884_01065 [Tenacibaculum sp. E3R01]